MTSQVTRVALISLMDKFLDCHQYGHNWRWHKDKDIVLGRNQQVSFYTEVLRCTRCTMKRVDTVHVASMDVVKRHYDPPPGYYVEKDEAEGRPHTRREFKLEAFRRRRAKLAA